MRPLAQAKGTPHQSTMQQRLMARFNAMAMAVVFITALVVRAATSYRNLLREALVSQSNQSRGSLLPSSLARRLHSATPPFCRSNWIGKGSIQTFYSDPVMPRIRGRSRRGAAWHSEESRRKRKQKFEAAESRRKRKQNFERAMAIAARRRKTRPRTPPMAYVEEVIPEGGPPSPPGHTLFMVPDNWNPSTSFGTHSKCQSDCKVSDPSTATTEKPYSPCYVEEEAPPSPPTRRRKQAESVDDTEHRMRMRTPARSSHL
jgi:hypothetical protein